MKIASFATGALQTNCYVVWGDKSQEALVVDPGADEDRLTAFLQEKKLGVAAYPLTHGHFDHIGALSAMLQHFPAPVGMHPKDTAWAFTSLANQYPPYYMRPETPPKIERDYAEGQTWSEAGLTYAVLELPGHSPGSVVFYFKEHGVMLSGDVLFQRGIGRTDLPGGDPKSMAQSLERLAAYPDDTRILSGHGPETTIGDEKRAGTFMMLG